MCPVGAAATGDTAGLTVLDARDGVSVVDAGPVSPDVASSVGFAVPYERGRSVSARPTSIVLRSA